MRAEKDLYRIQARLMEEERRKNNQLEEELRVFEENVLQGIMSGEPKIMPDNRNESPDPSAPKHKKIKIDDDKSEDNPDLESTSSEVTIGIKKEPPQEDDKDLKLVKIYIDEDGKGHYD